MERAQDIGNYPDFYESVEYTSDAAQTRILLHKTLTERQRTSIRLLNYFAVYYGVLLLLLLLNKY